MSPITNPLFPLLTIAATILFITGGALQLQRPRHGGAACIPSERAALLYFKKGITSDPAGLLTSWHGRDCCQWRGVTCNNQTGHVLRLHLGNPHPDVNAQYGCENQYSLTGEISKSLLSLEHLEHLDLSMNCLANPSSDMPLFLSSFKNLRYLNLSGIPFMGRVPPQFGNLSKLQYLDLHNKYGALFTSDITWLRNLSLLQYFDMSYVNLSGIADWPQTLNMIPSLRVIRLSYCSLDRTNQSLLYFNLTKLEKLDLSWNHFDHPIVSSWFLKATSLKYLNLWRNRLSGQLQNSLVNMTSVQVLDLSENDITGTLPNFIGHFISLRTLQLSSTNLTGTIPPGLGKCRNLTIIDLSDNKIVGSLPPEVKHLSSLSFLDISNNKISGSVPTEIGALSKLTYLYFSNNNLCGTVPTQIGTLSKLISFDISNNNFSGVITEEHFEGLISLKLLDLSSNINLKVIVNPDWFPPFSLEHGIFEKCQMGPLFPAWLQHQLQISRLHMSSTYLKDTIPDWFWITFSQTIHLDISDNKLYGSLPAHLDDMAVLELNLSSNLLTGSVPSLPRSIITLDISNNLFSGTLPLIFDVTTLATLIMFSNQIGGSIPESMCKLQALFDLDLSNNLLEGEIPQCFPTESLTFLILSNNRFSGIFPTFLQNCTNLLFLDLAWNKFSGRVPTSIGALTSLHFLRLSHNTFSGNIPPEITYLNCLQFLDLSANNLSGVIPWHLSNLTGMMLNNYQALSIGDVIVTQGGQVEEITIASQFEEEWSIITKGQKLRYGRGLEYFVSIDFSENSLTGEIPLEVTSLHSLINLNLSSNHLSGKIPKKIGHLHSLESLDLSKNKLYGEIPSTLSSLASLSYLNLSYNSLSGPIPSGRQLDTLSADDPSLMYIGNIGLCGSPLKKSCSTNDNSTHGNHRSNRQELDPICFSFGLGLGLVVGVWIVFCALLFKKTWRISYFQFVEKVFDQIYVFVVVKWASLTRKKDEE